MTNVKLLHYELTQAGLFIHGVASDFNISWVNEPTQEDLDTAASVIAAHDPNGLLPEEQVAKDAVIEYATLPDWMKTHTAQEANDYINGEIWNGMTIEQIEAYIDANITGTTIAVLRGQMIVALKQTAGAIIAMRGFFIITIKLLIYLRDLVIRFRKA